MNVFPKFNTSHACPVCNTRAQRPAVLVPIPGTEDDGVMEAKQVHEACWNLAVEMFNAEKEESL